MYGILALLAVLLLVAPFLIDNPLFIFLTYFNYVLIFILGMQFQVKHQDSSENNTPAATPESEDSPLEPLIEPSKPTAVNYDDVILGVAELD